MGNQQFHGSSNSHGNQNGSGNFHGTQSHSGTQNYSRSNSSGAATTATGRRTCSNDGDVDAGRARTTATGFQPSSSAHHHHSLQLLGGSSRRRRRCGGGERRRTAETLSPSSLHVRRRRRRRCCTSGVPSPSSLYVRRPVSVVAAPAADLGSQLSWLAELDELLSWWLSWMSWVAELDDVSNFNWLRCNTQHMLSVAPGAVEAHQVFCSPKSQNPSVTTVMLPSWMTQQFNYRNHCRLAVAVLPCGGRTAKWRPLIEMLLFCHKRCRFGYCDHCAVVLDHRNWDWA
ncbi:hypothetical protein LWI29_008227 [Acer saccharum]|uniref:Uncharacterized protein n=1 Tax=Acer saccharum TaxID=4024 RepID=A0AA39RTU4_ACESA|nr:hypothetical protein LWI29_008227 [Acer saccharum]